MRYTMLGEHHTALETVASVAAQASGTRRRSRRGERGASPRRRTDAMAKLAAVVDETLLGMGESVTKVERKQYDAYQRLRNFARVTGRQDKLLVYLKVAPATVELVPGFTRDVTGLGHHGTNPARHHHPGSLLRLMADLTTRSDGAATGTGDRSRPRAILPPSVSPRSPAGGSLTTPSRSSCPASPPTPAGPRVRPRARSPWLSSSRQRRAFRSAESWTDAARASS